MTEPGHSASTSTTTGSVDEGGSRRRARTIVVSGSGGLVGAALRRSLLADGHRVVKLVRRPARPLPDATGESEAQWSVEDGLVDPGAVEGADAIVHLAGESLASGRWTDARRRRIRDSRVLGTRHLVASLGGLRRPPRVLVSASAVGVYGDRGDEELTEASTPGDGFLADVCVEWEREAEEARRHGLRVAMARFGIILSTDGGALEKMLTPFRMGLGGRLGDGRQWFSWVTLADVVAALRRILDDAGLDGPVNVTAPTPVTNDRFTRALGRALRRPTVLPVPAAALRLAVGDMADEALLASARVLPRRLRDAGHDFLDPELDAALTRLLTDDD